MNDPMRGWKLITVNDIPFNVRYDNDYNRDITIFCKNHAYMSDEDLAALKEMFGEPLSVNEYSTGITSVEYNDDMIQNYELRKFLNYPISKSKGLIHGQ